MIQILELQYFRGRAKKLVVCGKQINDYPTLRVRA
jgi:hypothetical protein